ncbi:DEAD/DEAH box helicase [Candidatus Poribacteria bacterium]|nr:DEAD/DEAH box helicase [Candidatus Poribacteria bacterium]
MNLRKIFTPGGLISQNLKGYEYRPQQLEMAEAVDATFRDGEHLIVEAGTGVGKSFAYLVPAVYFALEEEEKIIISTNTINLQEQLINKDIPFLKEVLPEPFNAVLVKGRGNYLCLRRLDNLVTYDRALFDTPDEVNEIQRIIRWSNDTKDGSLADIEPQPMPDVWSQVASESDNCLSVRCPNYKECFYFKARGRIANADLVIINHHLLFSDWALRKENPITAVLPPYSYLILDEAQHTESVATEHIGIQLSNYRVKHFLDSLCNPKRKGGLLLRLKVESLIGFVEQARDRANELFNSIADWVGGPERSEGSEGTKRIERIGFVPNVMDRALRYLENALKILHDGVKTDDEKTEVEAHYKRCIKLRKDIDAILTQPEPDWVYWVELTGRRYATISLNAAPITISDDLNEHLFAKIKSAVMTSATLSTNRNFDYFKSQIGLNDCRELLVGSPFNYAEQAQIYIPERMPDPRNPQFVPAAIEKIKKYLKLTHGKAFVLFTSYKMMDEVYEAVAPYLEELGITAFKQGGGMSRHTMLEEFRQDIDSVLFGTSSFWEGADVQGEALSNVIIVRLPFSVPTHPVVQARTDYIETRGGNAFMEYSLPEAILRLKQGFGRLIRNKTDKGIVVILDSRVLNKTYGKMFLNSLPECQIIIE